MSSDQTEEKGYVEFDKKINRSGKAVMPEKGDIVFMMHPTNVYTQTTVKNISSGQVFVRAGKEVGYHGYNVWCLAELSSHRDRGDVTSGPCSRLLFVL